MTSALTVDEMPDRREGSVWDYISPSRLNLWLKCPLAFKLRYIDGVVMPPTPAQFVGQTVHAGLEDHYRHRMIECDLELGAVLARMDQRWDQRASEAGIAFGSVAEEQTCRSQAQGLVAAYLAQVPLDEPKPVAVELAIQAPLIDPKTNDQLALPLVGIIDLILPSPAGACVIDFKTAAKGGIPHKRLHELQLSAYAYLVRFGAAEPEAGLEIRSLIKTKQPRIERQTYAARSAAQLRRLFAVVRSYLDALDRHDFTFRPGLHCAGCEHCDKECAAWPD